MIRRVFVALAGLGLVGLLMLGSTPTQVAAVPVASSSLASWGVGAPGGVIVHMIEQPGNADAQYVFSPALLTVPVGTTVQWVNDAPVYHTVTSTDSLNVLLPNDIFDVFVANTGDMVSYTFMTPGTYFYFCSPHADYMFGTITVTA